MPPRRLPFREVRRKLLAAGFTESGGRGSHVKLRKTTERGEFVVIVPHHPQIAVGTLRSILRQAGITPAEFDTL